MTSSHHTLEIQSTEIPAKFRFRPGWLSNQKHAYDQPDTVAANRSRHVKMRSPSDATETSEASVSGDAGNLDALDTQIISATLARSKPTLGIWGSGDLGN